VESRYDDRVIVDWNYAVQDKRKKPRRPLVRPVQVVAHNAPAASARHYQLCDISQSGARIKAADMSRIPNEFYLVIRDDLVRWCRVMWRNKTQAGLRFIPAPDALPR